MSFPESQGGLFARLIKELCEINRMEDIFRRLWKKTLNDTEAQAQNSATAAGALTLLRQTYKYYCKIDGVQS